MCLCVTLVKDNASVLKELIECRNMLFGRWLKSGSNGDRQKYVSQRRIVAGAVKLAKNDWQQELVEVGLLSGGSVLAWRSIREMQKDEQD